MAREAHLVVSKADGLLALFGAAGVGVSFMEPRLFWFGALICWIVALIAARRHFPELKKSLKDKKRFRKYAKPRSTKVPSNLWGAGALISFCLIIPGVLYFNRTEVVLNYGVISNSWYERLIGFIARSSSPLKMQIGHSGTYFSLGSPEAAQKLTIFKRSGFTLESANGQLLVSIKIIDQNGDVVVELVRNQWKAHTSAFDRNYNNNSLEVKDRTGLIVLQVVLLSDRIQIQGEWWVDVNHGYRLIEQKNVWGELVGAIQVFGPKYKREDAEPIKPMFKYPSELHFGELL